jgi:peptide/nickel transport system permease protein
MSAPLEVSPTLAAVRTRRARRGSVDVVLWLAASVLAVLVVIAVLGPLVAPHPPSQTDLLAANAGTSADHPLGTDSLGRDTLSRLLYGARLSLMGPAIVVVVATALGTLLALLAAWTGGRIERIVVRLLDLLFAFPSLLFALIAVAVFGQGLVAPTVALAIAYTPYLARVVHGVAAAEAQQPYFDACRMAGLSSWRMSWRHLLPNVSGTVRAQATIMFGAALVDLAAISFLGLGVQPPTAEWGLMVADGRSALLAGAPLQSLSAGAMIVVTVVACNLLGERIATREVTRR